MKLLVKYNPETYVCEAAHLLYSTTISIFNSITKDVTTLNDGSAVVEVGSDKIPLNTFFLNIGRGVFKISNNAIVFNTGASVASLDARPTITQDTDTPLSFDRANTVVNLGRL